ncbi:MULTISPECIES: dTMP kinase [Thermoactinomyces]|jgi:dTMP kinase|uniref:Thymidylate kinase n=1 Tax=Thermoactinomyces daqus TaxID=1329516 RepID=A0A7W1X9J5_9BACL|nr:MULTISPECIES: dTMP kinase [Thermoactinomyces]MBA4542469.1 dTMP kinase [Thermoactinomyces daqus]MBH8598742.1 dTMP kinase [Thermoactinomyces sp. CICC 10523]MBH8604727.1 dTMP kinase [Thermoactinomyces sp. CICC 10522]MBH8607447.1 dTMP kinase [Thermoactinomyces sp. CICC 10521]
MGKGRFITFEGPEGAGKTTQIRLLEDYLRLKGKECITVREPGGTPIGDGIRQILLSTEFSDMRPRTEILLYAASRAQLVDQVIRPALEQGKIVLCDRYVDSSIAYQGYGAQWDLQEVIQINEWATGGLKPDRTYLLDLPVEMSQSRMKNRGGKKDRMELKEKLFHERVREGFLSLAQSAPERYRKLDACLSKEEIFGQLAEDILNLVKD